jgi:hypothetical protein
MPIYRYSPFIIGNWRFSSPVIVTRIIFFVYAVIYYRSVFKFFHISSLTNSIVPLREVVKFLLGFSKFPSSGPRRVAQR